MKKVMILLVGLVTTGLFAGGYSPSYGPGEEWNPVGSTQQAFVIIDNVTLNGGPIDHGQAGGSTGECADEDCDILGAMYDGECVGWTYMPIVNGGITLAIQLNDLNTAGVGDYPSVNNAYAPAVSFNFYDASESKMYYNVGSVGDWLDDGGSTLCVEQDQTLNAEDDNGYDDCADNQYFAPGNNGGVSCDPAMTDGVDCADDSEDCDEFEAPEVNTECDEYVAPIGDSCKLCGTADDGVIDLGEGQLMSNNGIQYGDYAADPVINITGNGTSCSSNGLTFGATEFCNLEPGCELSHYADGSVANFDALGTGGAVCAGFNGCGSELLTALNGVGDAPYLISNDDLCNWGGCSDASASNYCDYCTEDGAACTYLPADVTCSFDTQGDGTTTLTFSGEADSEFTCDDETCDGSYSFTNTTDASGTVTVDEDNGSQDINGNTVTHATECAYTMPNPAISNLALTPAEGCIGATYDDAHAHEGVTLSADDGSSTGGLSLCGLNAGQEYVVTATGNNASGSGSMSATATVTPYDGDQLTVTSTDVGPFSIEIGFDEALDYGAAEWIYQACTSDGNCSSESTDPVSVIGGLNGFTAYNVTVYANSVHGLLTGPTVEITTAVPPPGPVWKFDISAEMTVSGVQYINDMYNMIGFYYATIDESAANFVGDGPAPLPASDGYDAVWDVPEINISNPDNEIHFYIENNWDDQTAWGRKWANDVRALNNNHYASNNQTTFNGVVIAEMGGEGVLTITPGVVTGHLLSSTDLDYVPVYAKVNGGGHGSNSYYKLEDEVVVIPLVLESNTPVTIDFIVGNILPDAADGLAATSDASDLANGADWKPGSDLSFRTDDSCVGILIEGADFSNNQNNTTGTLDYPLTHCSSHEQRYPATSYTVATSSCSGEDCATGAGMAHGSHSATAGNNLISDSEDALEFATSYTYTVTSHNGAGTGETTTVTTVTTVANESPEFTDLCENDGSNNNDCETVISSSAVGHGSGPETEGGLVTDGSDDVHLYHTYTTAHDHIGRLSDGGTDADGLDQSGTPMTITLGSAYTDHEGYLLDASWSGDLDFDGESQFGNGNGSSVSFTVTEPNSGEGSSHTFDLAVTDNEWLTNGGNGSNAINTSITVTVLPEPNAAPIASISVPESGGNLEDQVGGGYWQVAHNGDNEYNCDDLIEYCEQNGDGVDCNGNVMNDEPNCDDNRASITLSHTGSSDPDCPDDDPTCEEKHFFWSEPVMGMTYNDLNMNGQYDSGEPCDGCLWSFDPNGIAPAVNDGPASITNEHTQRHDGGTGNIWSLTVVDNYGDDNTAARGFYVLQEPNTRAMTSPATDADSDHKYDGDEGGDDDDVHYLPEGYDVTTISINTGTVSDFDGDNITYTTTLNGNPISEASGDCDGSCDTGGFDATLEAGEYTVTTCAQDSYEGYEYLMYSSPANGSDLVDMNVQATEGHHECSSFSFVIIDEPAAVDVISLDDTDQGMSFITMSWDESDHSVNGNTAQLNELANNAVHYVVERTTDATDTDSWSTITTLNVVREYEKSTCSGKFEEFDTFDDNCENPNDAQANDDGEWFYMGQGDDGRFHFLDEGLESNTTYFYRIFAINSKGTSSGIGNTLEHSTEAKPTMSFSRDMSAEIYAAGEINGEMTNPFTASFEGGDDADGNALGGHNVNSVSSSYTTYEGTASNSNGFTSDDDGVNNAGNDSADISYEVTAWETDHGQSIEVCFLDAGDYWGYDKEGGCASTATFTGSQETLHHAFDYVGWHVFGAPLYSTTTTSMDDLMSAGLTDFNSGSDYTWFTQDGAFGASPVYSFGTAYFLGLNYPTVSFLFENGGILSSANDDDLLNDLTKSSHSLERGWNLISPKLVRSVDVTTFMVEEAGVGTYTWGEAQTLGLVSGEVLATDETSNPEVNQFAPWTGYWIHASRSLTLTTAPHADDLAMEEVEADYFTWNMNIEAQPVEGDARGDFVKLGLSEIASNDIKDGEDTEDIPVIAMADSYLDLYIKESNKTEYWKNTKEMISPEEGQAWVIQVDSENSNSDVRLSWIMDELEEAYDVTMYINGEAINMREETSVVVNSEALNNITVIVGNDPLASGLTTPTEFTLADAYPNPFNPITSMQLSLDTDGYTSVKVYNLMGQVVDVIHDGMLNAGFHKVTWNAEVIPSGVYLVKVEQGDKIAIQKVMLMK